MNTPQKNTKTADSRGFLKRIFSLFSFQVEEEENTYRGISGNKQDEQETMLLYTDPEKILLKTPEETEDPNFSITKNSRFVSTDEIL